MERIPNAVYTKELREEAVKMITEGGLNASEVARRLIHWPSLVWGFPGRSNKAKAQVCDERPVNSMRRLLSTRAYRHYNKEIYTRFLAQNPDVSAWKRPILRLIASIPEAWLAVLFMAYVLAGRIFLPDWRTLSLFHLAGDYERFERLSRFTLSRRQVTKPIGLLSSGGNRMNRILFIDANRYWDDKREFETLTDHPGLLYLCSYLRQEFGPDYFDIKIIYRDIEQSLASFKPDVVGISSVTQNFEIAKKHAKLVKSAGYTVIMGGAHISAMPDALTDDMDVGVVGEGEETLAELMKLYEREKTFANKESLHQVKGIVYSHNGKKIQTELRPLIAPLDKIPFPARDCSYINRGIGVFTSRGCPYKCRFCFTTLHWKKVRFFPPEYVVKEIKDIVEKYHPKHITIYDDLFIQDKKRLAHIVDLLKEAKIPKYVSFNCNVRTDHVDDRTAALLKEMGVRDVFMGVESGVQRSLTYLKGGKITVEQNRMAIEILKKHGIRCKAGIIIGAPTETKEEILGQQEFETVLSGSGIVKIKRLDADGLNLVGEKG